MKQIYCRSSLLKNREYNFFKSKSLKNIKDRPDLQFDIPNSSAIMVRKVPLNECRTGNYSAYHKISNLFPTFWGDFSIIGQNWNFREKYHSSSNLIQNQLVCVTSKIQLLWNFGIYFP